MSGHSKNNEMEISERKLTMEKEKVTTNIRKSSRVPKMKLSYGVQMKGGSPTVAAAEIETPKNIRRTAHVETSKGSAMAALHNLGNTCFLNSILQVLYHTPIFLDKISILGSQVRATMMTLDLLQQLKYDEVEWNKDIGWTLVVRLEKLLKEMKKIDDDIARGVAVQFHALRPYNVVDTIEAINSEFKGYQQQDAHELLKCLLMNIDEACNKLNVSRKQILAVIGRTGIQDRFKKPTLDRSPSTAILFKGRNEVLLPELKAENGQTQSRCPMLQDNSCVTMENKGNGDEDKLRSSVNGSKPKELGEILVKLADYGHSRSNGKSAKRELEVEEANGDSKLRLSDPCKYLKVDDEIALNTNWHTIHLLGSNVSLTCLKEYFVENAIDRAQRLERQRKLVQSLKMCCVRLNRLDCPPGLRDLNITNDPVSNLVTELFQGLVSLKTKCLNCCKETERREEFQDISLPIRRCDDNKAFLEGDNHDSVLSLILSHLDEVEVMYGDNRYWCDSCCQLVAAERRMQYEVLPNVLTIHLKRFAVNSRLVDQSLGSIEGLHLRSCSGSFTKTFDTVEIPLELPCLEAECRNLGKPCHRYSLYGVVSHTGTSLMAGHYNAYVKVTPYSRWDGENSDSILLEDKMTATPESTEPDPANLSNNNVFICYDDSFCDALQTSQLSENLASSLKHKTKNSTFFTPGLIRHDIEISDLSGCKTAEKAKRRPSRYLLNKEKDSKLSNGNAATYSDSMGSFDSTFWYECNDDVISKMTSQQLSSLLKSSGSSTPYMLFYQKLTIPTIQVD